MTNAKIHLQLGIPESQRKQAAQLFDHAFESKFSLAVRDPQKRLKLLEDSLMLRFAIVAIADQQLVGLAGFQTTQGSMTEGLTLRRMFQHLGIFQGAWALLVFSFFYREVSTPQELLMDGIAVEQSMRGQGIGTQLLNELKQYATQQGYSHICLDVIETNPRAKRLYERHGFVATKVKHFGYLRWLLGFGAATRMEYRVAS